MNQRRPPSRPRMRPSARMHENPHGQRDSLLSERSSSAPYRSGHTPLRHSKPQSLPRLPKQGKEKKEKPSSSRISHVKKSISSILPRRVPSLEDQKEKTRHEQAEVKKPPLRSLSPRAVAILFFALLAIIIVSPTLTRYIDHAHELAAARIELRDAQERVQELERQKKLWQDDSYVRAQARLRLGYVMPGDTLYIVDNPDRGTSQERMEERIAQVNESRRAVTPWFVTLRDSLEIAGESTTGKIAENPNSAPLVEPVEGSEDSSPTTSHSPASQSTQENQ